MFFGEVTSNLEFSIFINYRWFQSTWAYKMKLHLMSEIQANRDSGGDNILTLVYMQREFLERCTLKLIVIHPLHVQTPTENERGEKPNIVAKPITGEEDKNVEIKLKTFGAEQLKKTVFVVVNACSNKDYTNNIVGVCFIAQDVTAQKVVLDKFVRIQGDYKAIMHSLNPLIPPIFVSDENTYCFEWNTAMEKLSGWKREEVIGKMLVGEIFGSLFRLKGANATTKFMITLHQAIGGQEIDKFSFSFCDRNGKFVQSLLTANKRVNVDGQIIGAFCFLQIASPELQQTLRQRQQERTSNVWMKELAYLCREIKNPLNGIRFTNSLLEATDLPENQKQGNQCCL